MSNLSRQPPTLLIFVVLILSRGGCGGDQHQQQKTGKTEVGGHQNQDLSSSSLSNNAFSVGSSSGIGDLGKKTNIIKVMYLTNLLLVYNNT